MTQLEERAGTAAAPHGKDLEVRVARELLERASRREIRLDQNSVAHGLREGPTALGQGWVVVDQRAAGDRGLAATDDLLLPRAGPA